MATMGKYVRCSKIISRGRIELSISRWRKNHEIAKDVSRDDLATRGTRPQLRRTEMPSSVDRGAVILVEDVVSTGRTIRAAMDALMDFGRPQSVRVVALVDRGHRELPIKIDYVGKNIPTQPGESVVFREVGSAESAEEQLEVVVETWEEPPGDASRAERTGEFA